MKHTQQHTCALFGTIAIVTAVSLAGCATRHPRASVVRQTLSNLPTPSPLKDGVSLTARSAYNIALRRNPELSALRAEVSTAEARRRAAIQIDDPELRLSYGEGEILSHRFESMDATNAPWVVTDRLGQILAPVPLPVGTATGITTTRADEERFQVALRFSPPNPLLLRQRYKAADARVAMAEARLRAAEWTLLANIRAACAELRFLEQDIASLDRLIQLQKSLHASLSESVERGGSTVIDLTTVSRRHVGIVADRDRATRDAETVRRSLAMLLGTDTASIQLVDTHEDLAGPDDVDTTMLEETVRANRADLAALVWQCRAAERDLSEARWASVPWLAFIQGSYVQSTQLSERNQDVPWSVTDGSSMLLTSPEFVRDEDTQDEWRIDVGITLPIFSPVTRPAAPFAAERDRCKAELSAAWQTAVAQAHDALASLRGATEGVERFSAAAGPHVDHMRTILKQSETRGGLSPRDAARLHESIISSERTTQRLLFEQRLALIRLVEAVGTELGDVAVPRDLPEQP